MKDMEVLTRNQRREEQMCQTFAQKLLYLDYRLNDTNRVPHKGEWRRLKVICIPFRQTDIKWTHILSSKVYVMKTQHLSE